MTSTNSYAIVAFDALTGTAAGNIAFPGSARLISSGPVVGADGTVYVAVNPAIGSSNAPELVALGSGLTTLWTAPISPGDSMGGPSMGIDGTLYVGCQSGNVCAFGLPPSATAIKSVGFTPSSVPGGTVATGTVTLTGAAGTGGDEVTLTSSNPIVQVVPYATVKDGSTTATFLAYTSQVVVSTGVTITATSGTGTAKTTLTVLPLSVSSVTLAPSTVIAGGTSVGTVTVSANAPPGGILVQLSSSNNLVAAPSTANVTIPAGQNSANFNVTTTSSTTGGSAVVTATVGGSSATATLTVTPIAVKGLTLSPTSIEGGVTSTATVTLNGPAPTGGATVTLSSNKTIATPPSTVVVPVGATSAVFTTTTSTASTPTNVTITATIKASFANATLTVGPLTLISLTVMPASVVGGMTDVYGTVFLNGPAPAGGVKVKVVSNNAAAQPVLEGSDYLLVSASETSAIFPINTKPVRGLVTATFSATLGDVTVTAPLAVTPAVLQGFTVSPTEVTGGSTTTGMNSSSSTGTISLTGPAPAGGLVVTLKSSLSSATVSSSVTVPSGLAVIAFPIKTKTVSSQQVATLTATLGSASTTATLTIDPPGLESLSLSPASVIGPISSTGTVKLSGPAPTGGMLVHLQSSQSAATVPGTVTVAAGKTTETFTVKTVAVGSQTVAAIKASLNAVSQSANLTINPPTVVSVSLSPASVVGGNPSTGTVKISTGAPIGGLTVALSRTNSASSSLPSTVVIPAGKTSATFTVTTQKVTAQTTSSITATVGSSSKSATLTIKT